VKIPTPPTSESYEPPGTMAISLSSSSPIVPFGVYLVCLSPAWRLEIHAAILPKRSGHGDEAKVEQNHKPMTEISDSGNKCITTDHENLIDS
jgi:hypothetical protein